MHMKCMHACVNRLSLTIITLILFAPSFCSLTKQVSKMNSNCDYYLREHDNSGIQRQKCSKGNCLPFNGWWFFKDNLTYKATFSSSFLKWLKKPLHWVESYKMWIAVLWHAGFQLQSPWKPTSEAIYFCSKCTEGGFLKEPVFVQNV